MRHAVTLAVFTLACRAVEPTSTDLVAGVDPEPDDPAATVWPEVACGAWSGMVDGAHRGFVEPEGWAIEFVEDQSVRHVADDASGSHFELTWSTTSVDEHRTLWAEGTGSWLCDGTGVSLERETERSGWIIDGESDETSVASEYTPPYRMLSLDPAAEPAWVSRFHRTDDNGETYDGEITSVVAAAEALTVPAGEFDTFRVDTFVGGQRTGQTWWTGGVGLVQRPDAVLAWATLQGE